MKKIIREGKNIMFNQSQKLSSCIFAIGISLLLNACMNNNYQNSYAKTDITQKDYKISNKLPRIVELTNLNELKKWKSEGYCVIGTSFFYDLWTTRALAIDCAKKNGASVILVYYKFGEAKNNKITIHVPTSNTTYHQGNISGSNGMTTYSGTSTSHSLTPLEMIFVDRYYYQYAYFLSMRKNINGTAFSSYIDGPPPKKKSLEITHE